MKELFDLDIDTVSTGAPDAPVTASPDEAHSDLLNECAKQPGGYRTTMRDLAGRWGWSRGKVERFLASEARFVVDKGPGGTTIRPRAEPPAGHQRATTEPPPGQARDTDVVSRPCPEAPERYLACAGLSDDDDLRWWSDARRDGLVLFEEQRTVAVYVNTADNIVIRAERNAYEDDDLVIVVARVNLPAFIRALQALLD